MNATPHAHSPPAWYSTSSIPRGTITAELVHLLHPHVEHVPPIVAWVLEGNLHHCRPVHRCQGAGDRVVDGDVRRAVAVVLVDVDRLVTPADRRDEDAGGGIRSQ